MLNSGRFNARQLFHDQDETEGEDPVAECARIEHLVECVECDEVNFLKRDPESVRMLEFLWMTQKTLTEETPLNAPENRACTELATRHRCWELVPSLYPAGYRWMSNKDEGSTNMTAGTAELITEEEAAYGARVGFPTARRPVNYLREMQQGSELEVDEWFSNVGYLMKGEYPIISKNDFWLPWISWILWISRRFCTTQ